MSSDKATQQRGENKMENLSIEAKEIINDLFEKCYSPSDIKAAMEDGAYLEEAGIPQEISEEVHFFLSDPHIIYEAIVDFYDKDDNVIKSAEVFYDENDNFIKSAEELDPSIIYGKIKNFCALK